MVDRKQLMREIINEELAYHSSLSPFGEEANYKRKIQEKMAQLSSKERRLVRKKIEQGKFLRIEALFKSFYR